MNFIKRFLTNHVLANLTFVLVIAIGLITYQQLPRERDPTINFNWIQITTVFPGASAQDVEKRITDPLEEALRKVSDTRFVSSISRDSVSSILVRFNELNDDVFTKRVNDLRREIQNKEKDLPQDVDSPNIMEITSANGFPTATVVVYGNGNSDQLRISARNIQKDLERLGGVDTVDAIGLKDPELQVKFDPNKLSLMGLTPVDIANAINQNFRDISAGTLAVDETRWVIRWLGTSVDPEYLAKIPISTAGGELPLSEVAIVQKGREKSTDLVRYQGQDAVLLSVKKQAKVNDITLVERIKRYVQNTNDIQKSRGVGLALIDDQTEVTQSALSVMQTNALFGLCLVLLSTWVFLGLRIAFLVSIGIPFTLCATFWAIGGLGQTLNISVLLAVVICLGMLVDDSVVVVEAIYYRIRRGSDKLEAIIDGLKEVFAPVTISILTTISAFLPLMLLPGILGKFMLVIPLVVSIALLFSLVEAYWMLPAHIHASKIHFNEDSYIQNIRDNLTTKIRFYYSKWLLKVMRFPGRAFALIAFIMVFSIIALMSGMVKVNFFASDPIRLFYVNVEMPTNTLVDKTIAYTEMIENKIKSHIPSNELRATTSYAGAMFTETEAVFGENYGQILVSLNPHKGKMQSVDQIIEAQRQDIISTPGPVNVSYLRMANGPPTSKPINIKVRGDNFQDIRHAVSDIIAYLESVPEIHDISNNDTEGQPELILKPNHDAINRSQLSPSTISRITRLLVDGEIVASTQHEGEELNVRVKANQHNTQSINAYLQQAIALPQEGEIRLNELIDAKYEKGQSNIRHYNFRKTITIMADLDKNKMDTLTANNLVIDHWEQIRQKHPTIDLNFSGELDDIEESINAMPKLFLIGLGLMYLLLGTQFRSYWQPLMILSTVPLAFCGVVLGLCVTQNPMSLYTLYGVVALSGIAVNAAIVLISTANQKLTQGMSVTHATIFAARRRVIPILITSLTTIAGLFSLATGLGGKSLLWGPVATAIVWGLVMSTMLTLLVIPLLYQFFMTPQAFRKSLSKLNFLKNFRNRKVREAN